MLLPLLLKGLVVGMVANVLVFLGRESDLDNGALVLEWVRGTSGSEDIRQCR